LNVQRTKRIIFAQTSQSQMADSPYFNFQRNNMRKERKMVYTAITIINRLPLPAARVHQRNMSIGTKSMTPANTLLFSRAV
jgi:hypothetical protein